MSVMRIFHSGDIHYAPETLEEVDRCFAFAVDQALAHKCDAAILAGDTFDHKLDLHTPAVDAAIRQARRLADAMPVLLLQGTYSHDAPGSLDVFRHVRSRYPLHVADRIQQVALVPVGAGPEWASSEDWRLGGDSPPKNTALWVSCLPTVNKGQLAATLGAEYAAAGVGDVVYELLKGWAPSNLAARQHGIPTVVVSHGTVSGCVTEHGCPMSGLDHEYTVGSLFAAEASAVMLAHIHAHQSWEQDGRRIAYPGSVGRLHFGEMQDKGCLIWDVQAAAASCEFVQTPAKRLLQADCTGLPSDGELAALLEQAPGAHVRLRIRIDEEYRHSIDREHLTRLFRDAGAEQFKLEVQVNPIQRTRATGINRAPSLADKLAQWAALTETDPVPLVERLHLLQTQDPERIVRNLAPDTVVPAPKRAAHRMRPEDLSA